MGVSGEAPIKERAAANLSLGLLLTLQGRAEPARRALRRGIALFEDAGAGSHVAVGDGLLAIALLEIARFRPDDANDVLYRALSIYKGSQERQLAKAYALGLLEISSVMLGRKALAISWGEQAVNAIQAIRRDERGTDDPFGTSIIRQHRHFYEILVTLLASAGRLDEAQEVLQMFKEQELRDDVERSVIIDPLRLDLDVIEAERRMLVLFAATRRRDALDAERVRLASVRQPSPADRDRLADIERVLGPDAQKAVRSAADAVERADGVARRPPSTASAARSRMRKVLNDSATATEASRPGRHPVPHR